MKSMFQVGLWEYGHVDHPAIFEDVMIGEIMNRSGIEIFDVNLALVGGYSIDVYEPFTLLNRGVWN